MNRTADLPRSIRRSIGVAIVAALAGACGGSADTPTSPTGTAAVDTTTITIASGGTVTPKTIRVTIGSQVTLVNNDSRAHDMNSDPHPGHTTCPAINWGNIQPGQTLVSAALIAARSCGYHDHNLPSDTALQGSIIVQ